jgi:nicotinamidase-related amidase
VDRGSLVPSRTALLDIDLQRHFVESTREGRAVVATVNVLSAAFRRAGALVVHTRHVLRADGSNMGVLRRIPKIREGLLNDGAESAAFHDDLEIAERDVRLDKPRFGAFYGTDLESILRSSGIDTVVIVGISTPVCCDTTAREAHARDFDVLIVRDATASTGDDPDRYRDQSLDVLDGLFAQIVTTDEVLKALGPSQSDTEHSLPR